MGKFKRKNDPILNSQKGRLSPEQQSFIKAKVKELGSMEAVKLHYNKGRQTLVDRFALNEAKKIY